MLLVAYFTGIFAFAYSLKVIPERVAFTYLNESYIKDSWVNVRRYSRRGEYVVNMQSTTLHTWGDNISIHIIFFEYLSNEYKRSFVELHFKACEMLKKDQYIGKAILAVISKVGVSCPAPPGRYAFFNMTAPTENFPNVWPFEKGKVEVTIQQSPTNDIIGKGDLFLKFEQPLGKRKL